MGVVTSHPPSDPSTPELLAAVRAGDRGAFERLFRHWYARLADYAAGLTRSADTAEDAVQDVFIAIWKRREALPEHTKLAAYLHRAVRNRALNQLRGQQSTDGLSDAAEDDAPTATSADAELLTGELSDAIARALAELAPRTREVFQLSREQGLTYNEIAAALDISVKTVETLMGRALRQLRTRLSPHITSA